MTLKRTVTSKIKNDALFHKNHAKYLDVVPEYKVKLNHTRFIKI